MSNVEGRHDEIQGAIIHEYDGIEEADNQLPRWWVAGFLFTIAFGIAYWLGYEVYEARPSPTEEYLAHAAVIEEAREEAAANAPEVDAESLKAMSEDPSVVAQGEAIYQTNCVACHAAQGQGQIGPNLTDNHWIHGGDPMSIYSTIKNGVAAKGMPPWGPVLGPQGTRQAAAFVLSLRGKNVPGKPPEGDVYEP
ncbi:MAG: cbb3-type cytochrome c oxidase N-terminal domain-containing protein [Myxococcales bacterium]|jgi:cytochrome c oxidase cbb3-type subunit 3